MKRVFIYSFNKKCSLKVYARVLLIIVVWQKPVFKNFDSDSVD